MEMASASQHHDDDFVELAPRADVSSEKQTPFISESVSVPMSERQEDRQETTIISQPDAAGSSHAARIELNSHVLKLKGLPYSATEEAIREFFGPDFNIVSISFVYDPDGRPSGLGFAEFSSKEDALKALVKNGEFIGDRYVRLLHVPVGEMEEQVRLGTSAVPGNNKKTQGQGRHQPTGDPLRGYRPMGMPSVVPSGPLMLPPHLLLMPGAYGNQNALSQNHALPTWSGHISPWHSYPSQSQLTPSQLVAQIQNMSIASSGERRPPIHPNGLLPQQQQQVLNLSNTEGPVSIPRPMSHPPGSITAFHNVRPLSDAIQQQLYSSVQQQPPPPPRHPPAFPSFDLNSSGGSSTQTTIASVSATVKVRGLPYRSTPADILSFFIGYQYLPDSLQIGLDSLGRPSGEAWLTFVNPGEATRAVRDLNRQFLGNRYLELCIC